MRKVQYNAVAEVQRSCLQTGSHGAGKELAGVLIKIPLSKFHGGVFPMNIRVIKIGVNRFALLLQKGKILINKGRIFSGFAVCVFNRNLIYALA